jgi:hypothetical protein
MRLSTTSEERHPTSSNPFANDFGEDDVSEPNRRSSFNPFHSIGSDQDFAVFDETPRESEATVTSQTATP